MKIQTINFLIALKNASLLYKQKIFFKITIQIFKLIKLLYQSTLINSFKYDTKINKIGIYLSFESEKWFKTFKIMTTNSLITYIKYYDLCRLIIKHRVIFLSTTMGFITGNTAKKLKIGGKLLFLS